LGDAKLCWKEKTYKTFAKLSCGLSNKEYEEVIVNCQSAIERTKKEIDAYHTDVSEVKEFLNLLKMSWRDEI
jgi:serine/threonine-protein kinase HipA